MKKKLLTIVIPAARDVDVRINQSSLRCSKILVIKGNNPSKNRNIGIKKAKTPFVAFTNAHSTLSENWEDNVLDFFKRHKEIDIVGGPQLTPKMIAFLQNVRELLFHPYLGRQT